MVDWFLGTINSFYIGSYAEISFGFWIFWILNDIEEQVKFEYPGSIVSTRIV